MKRLAISLFALALCAAASAQVTITEPWVRGTVPQQKASGLFMRIDAEQHVRLLGGSSPVAERSCTIWRRYALMRWLTLYPKNRCTRNT